MTCSKCEALGLRRCQCDVREAIKSELRARSTDDELEARTVVRRRHADDVIETDYETFPGTLEGPRIVDDEPGVIVGIHPDDESRGYLELVAMEQTSLRLTLDARGIARLIRRLAALQALILPPESRENARR